MLPEILVAATLITAVVFTLAVAWHGKLDFARRGFFQIGVLLWVGWIFVRQSRHAWLLWWSPVATCGAVLLGLASLSLTVAVDRWLGAQILLHWVLCGLFAYLLAPRLQSDRAVVWAFRSLALIAVGVSVVGLCQVFTAFNPVPLADPPSSVFGNRNWAAQVIVLTLPAIGALLLNTSNAGAKSWLTLGMGLTIGYLIHTGTRSVWLATVCQGFFLALYCIAYRSNTQIRAVLNWKNALHIGLAVALGGILGVQNQPEWLREKLNPATITLKDYRTGGPLPEVNENSAPVRLAVWDNTLSLIVKTHLGLGVGLGNFGVRLPDTAPKNHEWVFADLFGGWSHAHNDWLQMWAELGIGFPVVCLLVIIVIGRRYRSLRSLVEKDPNAVRDTLRSPFTPFSLASILGLAVNMVFEFPMYNAVPPILLAVQVAIIEGQGLRNLWPGSRLYPAPPPQWVNLLITGGSLLAALLLAFQYRTLFKAEVIRSQYLNASRADQWREVLQLSETVGRISPGQNEWRRYSAEAHWHLGNINDDNSQSQSLSSAHYRQSIRLLNDYVQRAPDPYAQLLLGLTYEQCGELSAAESAFIEGLRLCPNNPDLYWQRGRLRSERGNRIGALSDFQQYRLLKPDTRQEADLAMAKILIGLDRFGEAVHLLEALAKNQSPGTESRRLLGFLLAASANRQGEGVVLLREALQSSQLTAAERSSIEDTLEQLKSVNGQ